MGGLVVLLTLVFICLPVAAVTAQHSEARERWTFRDRTPVGHGEGAFRQAEVVAVGAPETVPRVISLAALTSYFCGVSIIPGALAGLVGVFVYGLGLVSIPGIVVAWRIARAGGALMRRAPDAPERARSAANWAIALNVVGIAAMVVVPFFDASWSAFATFSVIYQCCSLAQAALMRRAASVLEERIAREHAARAYLPDAEAVSSRPPPLVAPPARSGSLDEPADAPLDERDERMEATPARAAGRP
jgi:hypothetical protein